VDGFIFLFSETFILAAFYMSMRKGALMPFPDIAIIYLSFLELVLYLQVANVIDYDFLESYSSYSFERNFGVISILLCMYAFILYIAKFGGSKKIDYASVFNKIKIPRYIIISIAVFLYVHLATFLMNANISKIFENDSYLYMTSIDVMNSENTLTNELILFIVPISLMSSVIFFFLYLKRDLTSYIFLPIFLWWLCYMLGAHSRSAGLMLGVGAFLAMFLGRKGIAIGLILGVIMAITQALAGRGGDLHGLSQVINAPYLAYEGITSDWAQILANSAEGIFVSSEALTFHPDLSLEYRLLSFSPLVNAIDGFQTVLIRDGVRLSEYVPMSAINEAVDFGPFLFFLYFGSQIFCVRMTTKLLAKNPSLLAVFVNLSGMFGFVQQFAYALRNCFRWFLYPILVCFFL